MFCPPQRHPSYTFIYDRPVIYRGDTLDQLTFKVAEDDGTPIVPASVCAQVKDMKGGMVLQHDVTIDPVTGAGAGASTFIGDYLYTNTGRRALRVGGDAYRGADAGLCCAFGSGAASLSTRSISARLSKKLRAR